MEKNDIQELTISEKLQYYSVLLFVKLLACLPFGVLYVLSDIFFYPFYFLVRYRRKLVHRNLEECFPQLNQREIIEIEKKFYHFFIDMSLESCKLISISKDELGRRMKFLNIEDLNDMMRNGKSISVFIGHYANWEWISTSGLWFCKESVVAQIYHQLRNKPFDKLMKRIRERSGNICVDMHQTVKFMANSVGDSRPYAIGFIADQSPRSHESKHFIPFLNHKTPVLTGTEKATKRYKYEAMFLSIKRVKRGYYECVFEPLYDDPASLPDFELTALYYKRLEREITENPEYYLWTHNRFKHALK